MKVTGQQKARAKNAQPMRPIANATLVSPIETVTTIPIIAAMPMRTISAPSNQCAPEGFPEREIASWD